MAEAVVATVVAMEPTEAMGAMAVAKVVVVSARTEEQTADPSVNLHNLHKNPAVNFGGNPVVYHDFMQQTGAEHEADSGAAPDPASGDPGEDFPSPAAPPCVGDRTTWRVESGASLLVGPPDPECATAPAPTGPRRDTSRGEAGSPAPEADAVRIPLSGTVGEGKSSPGSPLTVSGAALNMHHVPRLSAA